MIWGGHEGERQFLFTVYVCVCFVPIALYCPLKTELKILQNTFLKKNDFFHTKG